MKIKYILILLILTSLMLAKVYVANRLYYISRDIQKLSIQINALKEERNILKLKIEKLKYKNTIIDPLFEYKPKEIKPEVNENNQDDTNNEKTPVENENIYIKRDKKQIKKDPKELFNKINSDKELFWLKKL